MTIEVSRRSLITGLVSLVAAPAIVRVSSIMPVKLIDEFLLGPGDRPPYWAGLDDIQSVVRRVFVPRLYAQLFETAPALEFYLKGGELP